MTDGISPKLYGALANEIDLWRQDGLIGDALAKALKARYPACPPQSNAVAMLTTIGAVLVGLGALLYVGANWQTIATLWKIALLVAAIAGSHCAGWILKFEPGARPRLGTAFLLLGSFFYGAGIWLVAQMFNIDINYPAGLSALVYRCGGQRSGDALCCRGHFIIGDSRRLDSSYARHVELHQFSPERRLSDRYRHTHRHVSVVGAAQSSPGLDNIKLASTLWIVAGSGSGAPGLLMWGFALFGAYMWLNTNMQLGAKPFKYVGTCSVLTAKS